MTAVAGVGLLLAGPPIGAAAIVNWAAVTAVRGGDIGAFEMAAMRLPDPHQRTHLYRLIGFGRLYRGEYHKALGSFQSGLGEARGHDEWLLRFGTAWAFEAQGNHDAALPYWTLVGRASSAPLGRLAQTARKAGDIDRAERFLLDSVAIEPRSPHVWLALGDLNHYGPKQNLEAALHAYLQASALTGAEDTTARRVQVLAQLGRIDEAIALSYADPVTSSNAGVALARAEAYRRGCRWADAEEVYTRLLMASEGDPWVWYGLGLTRLHAGDVAMATDALQRAASNGAGFLPAREALDAIARGSSTSSVMC
jgi:tetratricopeptide (TPR) repeat protein